VGEPVFEAPKAAAEKNRRFSEALHAMITGPESHTRETWKPMMLQ